MEQATASTSQTGLQAGKLNRQGIRSSAAREASTDTARQNSKTRRKKRTASSTSNSRTITEISRGERVQAGRRAFDNLFSGSAGNGGTTQGYYNEYAGSDDGGDSSSLLSHVSLDVAPTYGSLVVAHIFSLLPCLALLLATYMLAWHAPCHIRPHPDDRAAERKACRRVLSDRVSISAFGIGIVCWLAAYALRPALWKVMETGISLQRNEEDANDDTLESPHETVQAEHDIDVQGSSSTTLRSRSSNASTGWLHTIATVLFVLLKTIALEMLRLFSVLLTNALVIAGLVRTPYWHSDGRNDHALIILGERFHLHWYDPRFTVGVWLAIGWALTEFIVTSWQMFDRLSLYASDFEQVALRDSDAETASMRQARDYGATWNPPQPSAAQRLSVAVQSQHLSDSEGAGEHSDSAATVRGTQAPESGDETAAEHPEVGPSSTAQAHNTSPKSQLLSAHRRARAVAEESGFSISPSDFFLQQQDEVREEDERDAAQWSALREKLDAEMESLQKARSRVELEQTFGQPLTSVPIVLCTLWRIDGWLWNLGSTLLMSASVTLAQGSLVEGSHTAAPQLFPPLAASRMTLLVLILLHWVFTSIWTLALPRLGFAAVTYTSMLVGAGLCLVASARWGLLV